jgi:hypothetical protein
VNAWSDTTDTTESGLFINDVYRDVVREVRAKVTKVTKTLTAGTATYTISGTFAISDLLSISYIEYNTSGGTDSYPVVPTSFEEILGLRSLNQTTGPTRLYALRDLDTIELYPAAQSSTDTLDIYYVSAPTALAAGGDIPSALPSEYHDVIALGATARMYEYEDAGQAQAYMGKYMARLTELKMFVNEKTGRIPRRTRVGYPTRRSQVPHDRSTYYSGDR